MTHSQLQGQGPVDLIELATYLTTLDDPPVLDGTDTALPAQWRDMLATFAGRKVQAAGPLKPVLGAGASTLTCAFTCAVQVWPAAARATITVSEMTVTVTRDGAVTLTLDGEFGGIAVVSTVTENDTGMVTAVVRSKETGAFHDVAGLVHQLVAGDGGTWDEVNSGLQKLNLALGQVAGFDYRLEKKADADPATYLVTSTGVAAALPLKQNLNLDVGLWLEDKYITGSLRAGTGKESVDVNKLLSSFGWPVNVVPGGFVVRELEFTGGLGDSYDLCVKLGGHWPIGRFFFLEELSMNLCYTIAEGFVAWFSGTVAIGSIPIEISASRAPGTDGGWVFTGGLAGGDALRMGSLIEALELTDVPGPVASLELTTLWLSYTTSTKQFLFTCVGDIEVTHGVTVEVGVSLAHNNSRTEYGGTLRVGDFELDLEFGTRGGIDAVIGAYHSVGGAAQVEVREWVAGLSPDLAAMIPEGLRIGVIDAKVIRVKSATEQPDLVVGFDLSAALDLSELPLVGGFLSQAGTLSIDKLQVLYSTGALGASTVAGVNALLGDKVVPLPVTDLKSGLAVQTELRLGSEVVPVALGLPPAPGSGKSVALAADTRPAPNSPSVWVQVQKQLGILQVDRIGLIYQHNALLFALDAAVMLGPLTLSFDGLAVGSPLDTFEPTFALSGLGVAFTNPSLTVSGALVHVLNPPKGVDFQYDGAAVVETQKFSLSAVGSYAQLSDGKPSDSSDGKPSLFVFAQLDVPIGEPPLIITALMAGFGFNRDLKIPTAAEVANFPLLVLDKPGQKAMDVLDVLEGRKPAAPGGTPTEWIAPRAGNYWLGVGAQLTVSEVVTATVVLAAEFGHDLIFAMLGTAILQLPLKDESAEIYVYAELGLEATLRPIDGIAQAQAQLSAASYVLTKDCHLTGGFAAALWFGSNPHAGQFVFTLGGYHPAFHKPSHFPAVPRLGIRWAVSSMVSITADAYLAVTPSCAMAGTNLQVLYQWGPVQAWFTAQADLLVSWRPFAFTAGIGIEIGASVTLSVFGVQKTFSLSVGAWLRLWGTPFGGTVTVQLLAFKVTIGFGDNGRAVTAEPLTWHEVSAMLPDRDKVLAITAVSGLDSAIPDAGSSGGKRWLVRARDLRFTTQSAIPASHLRIGTAALTPQPGDGPGIDIRPMNRTGLAGVHRMTVQHNGTAIKIDGWTITPSTHNLPASLWGAPPAPFVHTPGGPSADVVSDQQVGYQVQAPRPTLAPSRGVFPLSTYTFEEIQPGLSPLAQHPADNEDYLSAPDKNAMADLAKAAADPAKTSRDQVFAALSAAKLYTGGNDTLTTLAADATHLFAQAPMVQKAGNPS
ncbi:DUF6603 domain-containing protein [Nocardia pseudovaccinii]|uniref:DUF6603 domain-containing protein n=1 Tax=Nocardia pseudovaccinii TaxID=189540 RepID=UPI003D907D73